MKKIFIAVLFPALLLFAFCLRAQDFDDVKPVKKDTKKAEEPAKTEEVEKKDETKKAEPPAEKPEPNKEAAKMDTAGLSEDEAFVEFTKNIRSGNLEHVEALLTSFPKLLDRQDKFGDTPLYNAVFSNQQEVAEFLVGKKADARLANSLGDNPLHKAAQSGNLKLIELLINSGVQVWKGNREGETPLMKAISGNQLEAVKLLVKDKAELNTPDIKGDTPLHKAAIKDEKDIVKFLLDSGANASILNLDKKKAADLAKTPEIKELIEKGK